MAITFEKLREHYEVFVNTDAIEVECMNSCIDEFAKANSLRFTDVLNTLYDSVFPSIPVTED